MRVFADFYEACFAELKVPYILIIFFAFWLIRVFWEDFLLASKFSKFYDYTYGISI